MPTHFLSRLAGKIANCRQTHIKNFLINFFMRLYHVNMLEAEITNPHDYPTFNSFFTRHLKSSVRPLANNKGNIASPVDGKISQLGEIVDERIYKVKGFDLDLEELFAGITSIAQPFYKGHFITLYLAPQDYHRVHMPYDGTLKKMIYVPGRLFSVNPNSTKLIPKIFTRNERVICLFETNIGPMAVILIGAMLVASIHTVWTQQVTPTTMNNIQQWNYSDTIDNKIVLERGDELGHFTMGSSVIALFAHNKVSWKSGLTINDAVKLRSSIGNCNAVANNIKRNY